MKTIKICCLAIVSLSKTKEISQLSSASIKITKGSLSHQAKAWLKLAARSLWRSLKMQNNFLWFRREKLLERDQNMPMVVVNLNKGSSSKSMMEMTSPSKLRLCLVLLIHDAWSSKINSTLDARLCQNKKQSPSKSKILAETWCFSRS